MWRITPFVPAAMLLLLLAWVTIRRREVPSRKQTAHLALVLSLLAWLSIVLPLQFQSAGGERHQFVAQRDLGYFIGSALFLCAPFAVVAALSLATRRMTLGTVAAGGSAVVLAATGAIFVRVCSPPVGLLAAYSRVTRHACERGEA